MGSSPGRPGSDIEVDQRTVTRQIEAYLRRARPAKTLLGALNSIVTGINKLNDNLSGIHDVLRFAESSSFR